ncbi:MAG: ATPase, T2SS/T4P/T4SS family [Planctomycetota bacterium]|nr:ATPase, T2SS/T4P/T4SS family [Planctomycetota bacterium]
MPRLVLHAPSGDRVFPLTGEVTIGRHNENAVYIHEPRSSRVHARVARMGEGFMLEDMGSSNGTLVNGARIASHPLKHGDQIQIGATVLVYEDETAATGAPDGVAVVAEAPFAQGNRATHGGSPVADADHDAAAPRSAGAAIPGEIDGMPKVAYKVQVEAPDGKIIRAEITSRSRPYLAGRAAGHDLVLDGPGVEDTHLELEVGPTAVLVRNRSSQGTVTLSGAPLLPGQSARAGNDAVIGVGEYSIKLQRQAQTLVLKNQDADSFAQARRRFILKRVWPEFEHRLNVAELERRGAAEDEMRKEALKVVLKILEAAAYPFEGIVERTRLAEECVAEFIGLGPLEDLLADQTVTEIMCNGPDRVFVEQKGILTLTTVKFISDVFLRKIIERIVAAKNRRIDESVPYVDTRLDDGSRVHAIIPPLALNGATLTIRKFPSKHLTANDLIKFGALTPDLVKFLELGVTYKQNTIVSGGTGSGKTTLLNMLSRYIPSHERVITVEDSAELRLQQQHVVRLESRPANIEGKGAVTIRDLVRNCLRMRPDRIIVGECRAGEAFDMLQAMNTGHEGSMTTVHANNTREAVTRIESMCLMAGLDLPISVVRQQIAAAVNLIVQQSRLADGSRKVMMISEVTGMESGNILMQPIFEFKQTGFDANRKIVGYFTGTGMVPKFVERLKEVGVAVPMEIFRPAAPTHR